MNKLDKIKYKFYYSEGEIDLHKYGVYRMGLTKEEIKDYLRARLNTMNVERVFKKFSKNAGCNTGGMTPDGRFLMYRHDVKRFADLTIDNKSTFFD